MLLLLTSSMMDLNILLHSCVSEGRWWFPSHAVVVSTYLGEAGVHQRGFYLYAIKKYWSDLCKFPWHLYAIALKFFDPYAIPSAFHPIFTINSIWRVGPSLEMTKIPSHQFLCRFPNWCRKTWSHESTQWLFLLFAPQVSSLCTRTAGQITWRQLPIRTPRHAGCLVASINFPVKY
jgi:hypothetical protein